MLYIVKSADETPETDAVLSTVATHSASAVQLLQSNGNHRNADLAVHVLDLYTAAARVVARSNGTELDLTHWQYDLSHHCDQHTYAAIFLLAATAPDVPDAATLLARAGHDAVRQLLEQQ